MQDRFVDFIKKNALFTENDRILLGVSGGIDSMTMLHLFQKSGFRFAIAHCNFSLRGEESDGDQQLVEHTCEEFGIKLHCEQFETEQFASEHKLSIQVAARELRFNWFNELCNEFGYTKIAIAHNRDDIAETVILNLTRGTGLKGLTGIKPINGKVIRPLLFAGRDEIVRYATLNSISFREDSSNSSTKYARNRIRHNVISELEKINPSVKKSITETAFHLQEAWSIVENYLLKLKEALVIEKNEALYISIKALKGEPYCNLFLIEELVPLGFSHEIVDSIIESLYHQPGKIFYSSTHQLLRDRDYLIISERKENESVFIKIESDCKVIDFPVKLRFRIVEDNTSFKIPKDSKIAVLDCNKLKFPLTLRTWQPGDRFVPFGMDNYKKVSDFLIDQKVSLLDKDNVYVLVSGNDIIWVVGYRIDNRYKIIKDSKKYLVAESI